MNCIDCWCVDWSIEIILAVLSTVSEQAQPGRRNIHAIVVEWTEPWPDLQRMKRLRDGPEKYHEQSAEPIKC